MEAREIIEKMEKEDRLLSESAVMIAVQKALIEMGYEPLDDRVMGVYKAIENTPTANGWIPCSERLPGEKENPITFDYMQYPVMVNIDGKSDVRYYYFGNGHWRLGFQIMDEYVTHWMDIKPYQQKQTYI